MTQDHNLGFAYLRLSAADPDRPAIAAGPMRISHGDLHRITLLMALHMQRLGIGQDSIVAVRSDDLSVLLGAILASALLGNAWIFDIGSLDQFTALRITHRLRTDEKPAPGAHLIDASWTRPPEGTPARPQFPGYRDAEDLFLISRTSGTTGTPKLVGLSHRIVAARVASYGAFFPEPGLRVTGLFPLSAPALIARYLAALFHKAVIVPSSDPDDWLAEGVGLVFGSPSQIGQAMAGRTLPRRLRAVHSSGGKLPDDQVRQLFQSFEQVITGYGSVETNNVLSNHKSMAPDGSIRTRTVLRGAELQIVDETDTPLPPGQEGIVRIRNPWMAPGYIGSPEAEARAFRGGWFYPGDLGLWTTEGEFVVTGRQNDQFNLGGVKLNAMLMDFALVEVPGIREAICFMAPRPGKADRLTAFIAFEPGADQPEVLTQARIALMRLGGKGAVPERFFAIDRIPRNPNGKPDRQACVALLAEAKARRQGLRALASRPEGG
jgi:acyl-coenzyme A synthetase/AMP-(fatty) acid ligase